MVESRKPSRRAAFTLFEILIVIALIALLAGVAITNVGKIFGGGQESIAEIFVNDAMKAPLTSYRIHTGSYPTTSQGLQALITAPDGASGRWKGPYIETKGGALPTDPWGSPYQYRYPGTRNPDGYDLFSLGPDKQESADDIGNW
ncbi:MAG: type II secretion system major pseudopilin GspG [Opitutaceae bacterium]